MYSLCCVRNDFVIWVINKGKEHCNLKGDRTIMGHSFACQVIAVIQLHIFLINGLDLRHLLWLDPSHILEPNHFRSQEVIPLRTLSLPKNRKVKAKVMI